MRRARRFAIEMPLRYRRSGETGWFEGQMENISRSGVLFRARELMAVSALVEMCFALPVEMRGEGCGQVFCQGWIVRSVAPPARSEHPAMAAMILDCRVVRGASG